MFYWSRFILFIGLVAPSIVTWTEGRSITVYANGGGNNNRHVHVVLPSHADDEAAWTGRVCRRLYSKSQCASLPRWLDDQLQVETVHHLVERVNQLPLSSEETRHYLLLPGHHPIWPAHWIGHAQHLRPLSLPPASQGITLETIAVQPKLFYMRGFISPTEAQLLVHLAEAKLQDSTVVSDSKQVVDSRVRNSRQAWIKPSDHPAIEALLQRIHDLLRIPDRSLAEQLQVVKYLPGQHYHAHHDYFYASTFPENKALQAGSQRLLTVFMYLTDVEQGGETAFLHVGRDAYKVEGETIDWSDCTRGLRVTPRKGDALLWYNLLADQHMEGVGDKRTLHMGCDVVKGVKYAANLWIHNFNLPA